MAKSNKKLAVVEAPELEVVAPVTPEVTSEDGDENTPKAGDNSTWDKRRALFDVAKLGEAEAKGLTSRTEVARTLVRASSELSDVSADDAQKFYTVYAKGKARNPDAVFEAKDSAKSDDVQVAKLGVWLKLGDLPPSAFGGFDAVETFDRINDAYKNMKKSGEKLPQSRFDSIQAVARKWIKVNTKPEGGKYRPLTDDEVAAIILPGTEKEKKDDWQKLASVIRTLEGMETITGDKRRSDIIETNSTVGATLGAIIADMKRMFTDAGRADLVAPKEAKKAADAVAFLTVEDKRALMAKLQAELA